ncbi:MAG: hypothetical protein WCF23_23365 [Candidatus Nitrosopolaris sp.]
MNSISRRGAKGRGEFVWELLYYRVCKLIGHHHFIFYYHPKCLLKKKPEVVVVVDIFVFVFGTYNIDRGSSFGFNRSSSQYCPKRSCI